MGLLDFFARRKALTASPAVVEAASAGRLNTYQRLGGVNQEIRAAWLQSQSSSYAFMYEHQPAVRKVVDYIARNVAQLGLKLYLRESDTERRSDSEHPAARTMAHPNDLGPADQFIFNFVADWLVHDNAYALKFRGSVNAPRVLIQIPPPAIGVNSNARFTIDSYRIYRSDGSYFDVPPEDMIHWRGYNPSDPRIGISKLETLRQILAEDAASQTASVELMKSGLVKPGYIKRPGEAPEWSTEARDRFVSGWANKMRAINRETPVLEEGMEFADFGVTPKDAEMLAGRQFTDQQVASLYGLSSIPAESEEERKAFYADVLPPVTQSLASQLDFSLLEAEYAETDYYFEFDLNEKLRGDLENRASALTAATGGPWLTRNEARAKDNLPPVKGGDELITPMNVTVGDNPRPAPNVMPVQDPNKPAQDGSHREPKAIEAAQKQLTVSTQPRRTADMARQRRHIDQAKGTLERYYRRQGQSLKSKGTTEADTTRWNKELSDDIALLVADIVEREGGIYAARLGGEDFDMREVTNYVKAMAEGTAEALNRVTQQDIESLGVADAVARAKGERAPVAAASIGARATVFARREAAKQAPGAQNRRQIWIADTKRHAELDGVAVPLGSDWGGIEPGSEPNCACSMMIA